MTNRNENWKPVVGYEGLYEVSDQGRVRSLDRWDSLGRLHRGAIKVSRSDGRTEHQRVDLFRGERDPGAKRGKARTMLVHRVVALAFLGEPKEGEQVCHYDGNPKNNRVENLRWDTVSNNHYDAVRHHTHHNGGKTHCDHGHELTESNSTAASLKRGRRNCLSCNRARAYCLRKGTSEENILKIADLYFSALKEGGSMNKDLRSKLANMID